MSFSPTISRLLAAGLFLLLPGCLTIRSLQSADPYVIHRHNWWNYYERGRLYLREKNIQAAAADFKTAMGILPGARYAYDLDRWRARTYGMHMIEGYFPNRELGICLFELNQLQEAEAYLERSMTMEPSARAKFYLNEVRRKMAAAASPPQIQLSPTPQWTNQRTLTVKGTASGHYIEKITINGDPEFIELAEKQIAFERNLLLTEGRNLISVTAADLQGNTSTTNVVILADWQAPEVILQQATFSGTAGTFTLTCRDDFEIEQLKVNGRSLNPTGNSHTFTGAIRLGESLALFAADRAGNRLEWTIDGDRIRRLARQKPDDAPPRLHLADSAKIITLYNSEYALDIRAEDDVSLKTVELNGTALLSESTPTYRTLRNIPLNLGTNRFVLAAEDTSGKRTEHEIIVIRRNPEYLDRHYRLAAETSPISGELPDKTFQRRTDLLFGEEIAREPVRFYLLADQAEVDGILKEQALSSTKLADTRVALDSQKTLHADLIMINRVLSDGAGQTIYTKVKDSRSGEELFIEDVYVESKQQLQRQISGLVMKIEQKFPLIRANVIAHGAPAEIDSGARQGVQKGTRFLVIRSEGPFEEGHVLLSENRPVELIASEVESATASGIIVPGPARQSVQRGDYVFTR